LREVYYHLGKLALNDSNTAKAQEYLRRSGYSDFDHPITLATPFSEDKASGHAFAPRRWGRKCKFQRPEWVRKTIGAFR